MAKDFRKLAKIRRGSLITDSKQGSAWCSDDRDKKGTEEEKLCWFHSSASIRSYPYHWKGSHLPPAPQGDRAQRDRLHQRPKLQWSGSIWTRPITSVPQVCRLPIISFNNSDQNFPLDDTTSLPPEEIWAQLANGKGILIWGVPQGCKAMEYWGRWWDWRWGWKKQELRPPLIPNLEAALNSCLLGWLKKMVGSTNNLGVLFPQSSSLCDCIIMEEWENLFLMISRENWVKTCILLWSLNIHHELSLTTESQEFLRIKHSSESNLSGKKLCTNPTLEFSRLILPCQWPNPSVFWWI